jgi:hypothetical protein
MLFSSLYSQYVGLWKAAVIPRVCSQWIDIETLGALVLLLERIETVQRESLKQSDDDIDILKAYLKTQRAQSGDRTPRGPHRRSAQGLEKRPRKDRESVGRVSNKSEEDKHSQTFERRNFPTSVPSRYRMPALMIIPGSSRRASILTHGMPSMKKGIHSSPVSSVLPVYAVRT